MKKINTNNKNIDQVFKEGLADFQVPPPSFNKQVDSSDLDKKVKSKMDSFEMTPAPENWNKIKRHIPLNLQMQRHLNFWSKVAAVLVVGLVSSLLFANYIDHQEDMANQQITVPSELPTAPSDLPSVLDMDSENPPSNERWKKDKDSEMASFKPEIDPADLDREPLEELPTLESKIATVATAEENALNAKEKVERDGKNLGIPTQGQVEKSDVIVSQTADEKKKETAGQNQ